MKLLYIGQPSFCYSRLYEIKKIHWAGLQWHYIQAKFREIGQLV
jgi:hypothetical protein